VLYYALVFLVVGLVAGVLNLAEGSLMVVQMSWMLFVIGIVLGARSGLTIRTGCSKCISRNPKKLNEIYRDQGFLEPCGNPGMTSVGEGVLTLTR